MKTNEYQTLALRTENTPTFINPERYSTADDPELEAHLMSRLMHGMMGMVTEIGEAMDVLKKHFIYGKPIDLTNLMEEAGDKLWYIALILDAGGIKLDLAMERNISKLRQRFPSGFTEARALNRDLVAEATALNPIEAACKILIDGLKYYEHDGHSMPKHVVRDALVVLGVKREEQP